MVWPHAGRYGPDALLDPQGEPQPGRAVTVRLGGVLATLYADRDRAATLGNPVSSDARGNLSFYADPGTYTFDDGTQVWTASIYPDPEDVGGVGGGAPALHADTHATGGSDPVTPGSIGAASAGALAAETAARTDADAALDLRLDGLEGGGAIIREGDARLTDARTPTGGAGGVLSGSYPNPGFAVDPATQAELDAGLAATLASANGYTDSAVAGIVDSAPGTLDTLNELAAALGDDPNLAATLSGQIGAKADTTALTAETSARVAADDALDDRIDTANTDLATHAADTTGVHGIADTSLLATQADLATHAADTTNVHGIADTTLLGSAGVELGYAERVTNDTTTSASVSAAVVIGGLSVTVVGTGRPVDIEFFCPQVRNSVANHYVGAYLLANGSLAGMAYGVASSPVTGVGRVLWVKRRRMLTAGVSYTFEVAKWVEAGGETGTFTADADGPMYLSVTGR